VCSAELMSLQIQAQRLISETQVSAVPHRCCITFSPLPFSKMRDAIKNCAKKSPNLNYVPVDNFVKKLEQNFSKVVQQDEDFCRESLYESSADVFEAIELHLKILFEQILLLRQRLLKYMELRNVELKMSQLDMKHIVQSIDKEVESAYVRDLELFHFLCEKLDNAENSCQIFLDILYTDRRFTSTLTKEQFAEAGKLFQLVIKIRSVEREMEESVPELSTTEKQASSEENPEELND